MLFAIAILISSLEANEFVCAFKKVSYVGNETFAGCELKNVKFEGRGNFALSLNFTLLEAILVPVKAPIKDTNKTVTSLVNNKSQEIVLDPIEDSNKTLIGAANSKLQEIVLDPTERTIETVTSLANNKSQEIILEPLEDSNKTLISAVNKETLVSFVSELKFKSSKISSIPNIIFRTLPQLKKFDASNVELHLIDRLSFNFAENLEQISLHSNLLTAIIDSVFVHTKNLKFLDLSGNKIKDIAANAFISLENLEKLSLSINQITTLDDTTFAPLANLQWITLDRNQLKIISSELFSANYNLRGILLNANSINVISPHAVNKLEHLKFLMLAGNNCINMDFKNHFIQENAGVKYELRSCFKEYRKLGFDDDKHNITRIMKARLEQVEAANKGCESDSSILEQALMKFSTQTAKPIKDSGN